MSQIRQLDVPIYLNQKIVFDLVATINDGFTEVTRIKEAVSKEHSATGEVKSELGNKNIFAFLGINVSGRVSGTSNDEKVLEKVHTPSSLFNTLKHQLEEKQQVKKINCQNDFNSLKPGDFVEITGKIIKNSLVTLFDNMAQMMELATVLQDYSKGQKGKTEKAENKKIVGQIKAFSDSLKSAGMIDLICQTTNQYGFSTVMPVYMDYFFNGNMNEIVNGEFKVFGKLTNLCKDNKDSIDLLRNTSFTLLKKGVIENLIKDINLEKDFDIGKINTVIDGPALLMIPIAIYV